METSMRAAALLTAGLILGAVVGCGTVAGSGSGGHGITGRKGTTASTHLKCANLRPSSNTVSLTNVDNGKTVCVRPGIGLLVVLRSQTAHLWTAIVSSSAVLTPRPNGALSLVRGATGGYFVASAPGHATLTSIDSRCSGGPRPGVGSAHSGHRAGRCPAPSRFSVAVYVRP
jgi:hypothetical protein